MSDMTENLVLAARDGDFDAMGKLYSRTLKSCYYFALKLTASESEAAEITKKTYGAAFSSLDKLTKPEAFETWLKQGLAAQYKKTVKFTFGDAEAAKLGSDPEFLPENAYTDLALASAVEAACDCLPTEQRALVALYYCCHMPIATISKYFNVSESTVGGLMIKARKSILSSCNLGLFPNATETSPVLARIFARSESAVEIQPALVREMFIYVIDFYKKQEELKKEKEEQAAAGDPVIPFSNGNEQYAPDLADASPSSDEADDEDEADEEAAGEQEDASGDETDSEESDGSADENEENISSAPVENKFTFFSKTPATVAQELVGDISSADSTVSAEAIEEINSALTPQDTPEFAEYSSNRAPGTADDSEKEVSSVKKPLIIAIICVVIVALVAAGIFFFRNKQADNTPDTPEETSNSLAQSGGTEEYKWVAGGFDDYTEIQYFNEYACMFKSKDTGLYGLMDYKGNVILEANYQQFRRCSEGGRQYSSNGKYHYTVNLETTEGDADVNDYELFFNDDGTVRISTTPYRNVTANADELGELYEERDRYFNGLAAARKEGKWGYVSENDEVIIPFMYEAVNNLSTYDSSCTDYCRSFDNGLVAVKKDGMMGIVDMQNNQVVPFEYSNILQGDDGVFIAAKNGSWGIITVGKSGTPGEGVTTADLSDATPHSFTYRVNDREGANVRSDAGAYFEKLGELSYGTSIQTDYIKTAENGKKWVRFEYNSGYGWVAVSTLVQQ